MVTMTGIWSENGKGIGDHHIVYAIVEVGTALAPPSAERAEMNAKRL
jgi:hypothetical protein